MRALLAFLLITTACNGDVSVDADPRCEAPSNPDPLACVDVYDCPRDCDFYACNFGRCVSTGVKEDGLRCSLPDPCDRAPAFCRAGACEPGCDYALDCPRPSACESVTCAGTKCIYDTVSDVPCAHDGQAGTCHDGICL